MMIHLPNRSVRFLVLLAILLGFTCPAAAAEVKILLPLGRTAYQTNEWIDVSVVRSSPTALPASLLTLTLNGADGSVIAATFPAPARPVQGNTARSTEHLHLNGWMLRPGKYTLEAKVDNAHASIPLELYGHVRQSSFRLINWGRAKGKEQLVQGEDSLGFNLFYGHSMQDDDSNFLRAGVDFMANCVMSGGHQMDLRNECDWSDPYVIRGGTRRVVRQAMIDRTRPNVPGVHFYDEPGLTWDKDPVTGEYGPHAVPAQKKSYTAAFGKLPISSHEVDPKKPESVARWQQWAIWKLGFMDAAWKEAQFGVSQVKPDLLSVTQSQYGFSAFTDGYYFNVVRSLPITSGHGGYHDFGPCYFNPSYHLEMARARAYSKPNWYLPTWYGNTTSDQFRLEQYLSFQTGIQGLISPPDLEPATNPTGRQGIVESNQLTKKLGTIFTTMRPTRPPVAMLYSLSQLIHNQAKDTQSNYAHQQPQGKNLPLTYLAGKMIAQPFLAIVEEDVLDGTLAAEHKAVVLTSLDYLAPEVIQGLESFIQGGGLVLLTSDCTVQIKGAIKLDALPKMPDQDKIDELTKAMKYNDLGPYTTMSKYFQGALPLAKAIKGALDKAAIKPVLECNAPSISASRQAQGDIEYLFAVNATHDDKNTKDIKNGVKATAATISLVGGEKPTYDAIVGGSVPELQPKEGKLTGSFRFGPGQMRVFARTSRPIGGVRVATPLITRDFTQEKAPIQLELAATLVDNAGRLLSGSAPLLVRVIDPLGMTRFELYRATRQGQFSITLPLAVNDPAGEWKVLVRELLNNGEETLPFHYAPPLQARAIAGATPRAVYAVNDRENAFRFGRIHHDVTIVKGTSVFNDAAAKRLAKVLEPWGVRCKEMPVAEASKSRNLTEEEARTWCGLIYGPKGQIKPGEGNPPVLAGFAVQGPVILLGNAEDNPLIRFLQTERFLPYKAEAGSFPGEGRGFLAWQRDAIGPGQESITLIAHDEAGINEAVGSFYEAVAGIDPLTKWTLPQSHAITPAKTAPGLVPAAKVTWTVALPDRVLALKSDGKSVIALSHDGSRSVISPDGKLAASKALAGAEWEQARTDVPITGVKYPGDLSRQVERADRMLKLTAGNPDKLAVAYWGGTLRVLDKKGTVHTEQQLPQDITALTWLGDRLIAGLADGRVVALEAK
jgi:hypothetical protein